MNRNSLISPRIKPKIGIVVEDLNNLNRIFERWKTLKWRSVFHSKPKARSKQVDVPEGRWNTGFVTCTIGLTITNIGRDPRWTKKSWAPLLWGGCPDCKTSEIWWNIYPTEESKCQIQQATINHTSSRVKHPPVTRL